MTVFRVMALTALVLAGCERSDTNLRPEDIAARGNYIAFSETFTGPVWGGTHRTPFLLTCVDGSILTARDVRIVSVSGDTYNRDDFRLAFAVTEDRRALHAWVSRPGPAIPAPQPQVTVEMSVGCAIR